MPNIIEITDLHDPSLAPYFRLTEAQLRNLHQQELLRQVERPE